MTSINYQDLGKLRHWRKRVCGVLSNGALKKAEKAGGSLRRHTDQNCQNVNNNNHKNSMMRPSVSARSFRSRIGDCTRLDEEADKGEEKRRNRIVFFWKIFLLEHY